MVNIKVAVRIRPLSQRELLHGEEIIVRKDNKSVLVTNPKIPERQDGDSRQRTRRFAVDFCYDSMSPEGCTQEAVYKEIGSEVLNSMFEGYNACVLAYGHSASGKTYTIMGLQSDPGLTPRLCEGLFEKLSERNPDGRIRVQIIISFLEIYNEKVRDLLGSEEAGGNCGNFSLRVREHPRLGPYVQGLSEHLVTDEGKLLELLTTGTRRRSTAATESNVHSSRSHAVFSVRFRQSDGGNYETEKSSKVHLVDLAGSLQQVSQQETPTNERASSSQSKARLQEGANINKSLVTLGNVISALAESHEPGIHPKEHSRSWQPFVPYRDSVLTWLLKDTLGGNSNTIMIATVSPARSCLSETVNTLRYAKRTKKIVNRPIVNEDPKVRTIRELRKEIARLRGLLVFFQSCEGEEEEEEEEERLGLSCTESKWPEPEGTHITIKESDHETQEIWEKKSVEDDSRAEEERNLESAASSECESGVGGERAAPSGGDACDFGDEKKSDVNGSVNDNFSHETQIFSDSLESFSSGSLKSENSRGHGVPGPIAAGEDGRGGRETNARSLGQSVTREFGSCENLSRRDFPGMLHRSRPDLIKGISTRSKESLPLGGSRSYTDVSNLSNSASENSLNSSGSADVQPLEGRPSFDSRARERNPPEATSGGETRRNEPVNAASKKKEKRLEIVEAVTSRLYVAKKKEEHKPEALRKEDEDDDDGELEELKLCKRARMKLFDLSRKLAMTRKLKKTVDSDTQTESTTQTLRVKEKCVTTEPCVAETAEGARGAPAEGPKERTKPYVIMNQVFIPRSSNYVVECGKVVRIEAQESATQSSRKDAGNNALPRDEDCFSEDSLDLETRNRGNLRAFSLEGPETEGKPGSESRAAFVWPPNINRSSDSKSTRTRLGGVLFNGLPLGIFEGKMEGCEEREWLGVDASTVFSGSRREGNVSSENSFTSTEGAELNSWSETSSEDFVFCEGLKDKDSTAGEKTKGERELYTITENSEHSDPSDTSQGSSMRVQRTKDGITRVAECRASHESEKKSSDVKNPRKRFDSPASETSIPRAEDLSATKNAERLLKSNESNLTETHLQSNPQKQYLNLDISSEGKTSVDTHLFAKAPKKDQSTDAMSTSADSITFVFMGPAKPETSVLMEIIKRSLGGSHGEAPGGRRRSRNRGVQCDAGLMRSVSVDTAMMALSRIAKNQEPPIEIQRASSLGGLRTEETFSGPSKGKLRGKREKSCSCLVETGYSEGSGKWKAKHSVGTSTNLEEEMEIPREKNRKPEADKPKKSVSWVEEVQERVTGTAEESEAGPEEPDAAGRRVRFLGAEKDEEAVRKKELVQSGDNLTAFLREATQLLKAINSRSSKMQVFQDEEESDAESKRKTEENERKTLKKAKSMRRSGTEGCLEKEGKEEGWCWKTGAGDRTLEERHVNLTWPRRRPGAGKPPAGTLGRRPPRPLPPPRLDLPALRPWSHSPRSWNLSSLSLPLGNSCLGDAWSRASAPSSYSSPVAIPITELPELDLDSLSDMESELEERCRRLEVATQKDERRERARERNGGEGGVECRRAARSRRRAGKCAGSCTCGESSPSDPCKHLWSKGCRSSFELDSFGPGSAHCPQLCMFCRQKEAETYYSALNLNSQCTSGLCRLNYYGYCPCSPVKLHQVVSSPRAYMQHLLALRKQIVGRSESAQSGSEELQRKSSQGLTWRDRARLSDSRGCP